jgi:hypothetical protein
MANLSGQLISNTYRSEKNKLILQVKSHVIFCSIARKVDLGSGLYRVAKAALETQRYVRGAGEENSVRHEIPSTTIKEIRVLRPMERVCWSRNR